MTTCHIYDQHGTLIAYGEGPTRGDAASAAIHEANRWLAHKNHNAAERRYRKGAVRFATTKEQL